MFSRSSWQLVGPLVLWGKMPGRGDFIRRNLPFEQEEALEEWVGRKRSILSPEEEVPRKMTNGIPWNSLEPRRKRPVSGHAGQPWCFVLPPRSLPSFTADRYLIGVWMDSSDKVGRKYPVIMIQTAARRWVGQYFAFHTERPREWLFHAARLMAHSIRTQRDGTSRLASAGAKTDPIVAFQARLAALWSLYAPDWRNFLGKRISFPGQETRQIRALVDPAPLDDPIHQLEGVRFLPWADWPDCLLNTTKQEFFWQQDLQGRFISAIRA